MTEEARSSTVQKQPLPPILQAAVDSPRVACAPIPKRQKGRVASARVASPKKPKRDHTSDKPDADGSVTQARRLRTGTSAVAVHTVRCRPGTFEWRYGRRGNSLYHAGAEFARLYERAGVALAPSISEGSGGSGWKGMPDGRVMALDRVKKINADLGGPIVRRLVSYCVEGRTPREIAATHRNQVTERHMATVLEQDLSDLAQAMNFAT